jgi:hypothetical protein
MNLMPLLLILLFCAARSPSSDAKAQGSTGQVFGARLPPSHTGEITNKNTLGAKKNSI